MSNEETQQQETITPEAEVVASPPASDVVEATEPVVAEETKKGSSKGAGAQAAAAASAAAAAVAPFTPDFKYKFNGQEKEIDAFWRPLIKDPDTLKRVKDAIERSEATEMHREAAKTHEAKLKEWEPMVQDVQRLQEAFESAKTPQDFRGILEELGFTRDHLKDVVREYLKEEQLPPEQKAMLEAKKQAEVEKQQLLMQNNDITTQYNNVLRDITSQQIDLELGKAENIELKKAYEAVNGEGTFRQLLLERGSYYVSTEGRHVPPSEVMGRIAKEFAPFLSRSFGEPAANTTAQPQAPVVRTNVKAVPQVGSGGGSPAKPSVMSLADLKARYEQLTQQQE